MSLDFGKKQTTKTNTIKQLEISKKNFEVKKC